jgi:predicted DNA-binding transcriptional regulator AlpA
MYGKSWNLVPQGEVGKDIHVGDNQAGGDQLLCIKDVAVRLAVCTRTVERLVAKGELVPPVKVAKSSRWFFSDVEAYMEKLRQIRSRQKNPCAPGGRP